MEEKPNVLETPSESHEQLTSSGQKSRQRFSSMGRGRGRGIARGRSTLKGFLRNNEQETKPGGLADAGPSTVNSQPQGDRVPGLGIYRTPADYVELPIDSLATIPGTYEHQDVSTTLNQNLGDSPVLKPVTTSVTTQQPYHESDIPSTMLISPQQSREIGLQRDFDLQPFKQPMSAPEPPNYHSEYVTLLFSSLPSSWTVSELEVYCENLGQDAEVKSANMLEMGRAKAVLTGLTSEDISIIKTKTHRSKKSVFSVTCVTASSPDISKDVSSRLREASQITPTSGTADSAKSPLWTTKMPLATDEPFSLSFPPQVPMRDPILNFETVSRAEPINTAHQEVPEGVNSRALLFSLLPPELTRNELGVFCETLGENVKIQSLDMLGGGKARAVLSGLTSQETLRAEKKTHKAKGSMISICFESPQSSSGSMNSSDITSCKGCIIEVKNIPDECEPEILELYFESPVSGGAKGCVKDIKLAGTNVAHVTLHTPEVAAQIISKGSHVFLKKSLHLEYLTEKIQKYELDKLYLEMIPVEVDEVHLQYYLTYQLKIDFEEFHIKRFGGIAVVSFKKDFTITELEQMILRIQSNPLKEAVIKAELYKVCTSVKLSSITKHYSEEFISLYFESKRSGGGENKKVTKVELHGNGEAIVTFENPDDTRAVASQPHSDVFGRDVQVEMNDQLCNASQRAQDSFETNSSSDSILTVELCKIEVRPLLALSLSKNTSVLDHQSKSLEIIISIDPRNGHIVATPTIRTPAGWQEKWKLQIEKYIREKTAVEEDIRLPKEGITELYGQLSNLQTDSESFVYKFGKNSTSVSIAGHKETVDCAKDLIKVIYDEHTVTSITLSLNLQEYDFISMVKLSSMKTTYPDINFQMSNNNLLTVKGTVQKTREFCQAFDELRTHAVVPVPVDQEISIFLQQRGCNKLLNFISSYSLAVHFSPGSCNMFFLCEQDERESANTAMQKLLQLTTTFKYPLPRSFISLKDKLEDFVPLCQDLEQQSVVTISVSNAELQIVGFYDGVQQCKTHLLEYIREKCTAEFPVTIEAGIWRLVKIYMTEKWKNITDKCKLLEVKCKEPLTDEENCILVFTGDQYHVDQIISELSDLQSTICKLDIEKNQPGTCTFFRSEKARTILNGIEAQNKVTIEVTEPDEEETGLSNSSPSKFEKKCTAFFPKGGKKLIVYVGDITEFDKADVIVNAANETLKHIGGVALAIAEKGGPVIQSDSDNHVKKRGKVDTGDVWMTENVGFLPCKALVHAVGPKWNGGKTKAVALLRKACLQSLCTSHQKFCSISFPAISSGVYGFPLEACAETMVKTFIQYSELYASSKLQEIYLVLYKQSDSGVFISALQSQLPGSSINIEQSDAVEPTDSQPQISFTAQTRTASKGRRKKMSSHVGNTSKPSPSALPIKLHKGRLLDVKADAYINSTNSQLNLSQGAVAQALLKAGGQQLQSECTAKAPLKVGEVAVTGPGNILCQNIVHTVVPKFDGPGGQAEKILRSSVRSCLEECTKLSVSTVAFPSIGTGNLSFPNDVAAKIIVSEICCYLSSNTHSSIRTVHLVIYMPDTYQAFQVELQANQVSRSPKMHFQVPMKKFIKRQIRRVKYARPSTATDYESGTLTIGQISVNIILGDIGEESTDVIVVPTNPTMTLLGQGVAGAILKKGGPELQVLCDTITANGMTLSEGKVITTSVTGALKSKALFHIVFKGEDEKKFVKVITACLQEAEKKKYQSISFPAIGTGSYGYPPHVAALGMYKAIEQNSQKLKHVQLIRIVLYPPDVHSTFNQVFHNPTAFDAPGFFDRAKNFIGSVLPASWSPSSDSVASTDSANLKDETNQAVVIRVYGETEMQASSAEMEIEKLIAATFISKEIDNQMVSKLSREEFDSLQRKAKELHVDIVIDREPNLSTIRIKGDETNVHKMHCFTIELLAEVEKVMSQKEEAEKLYKTIQWSRMDSNDDEEEYSMEENYKIESAFRFRGGKGSFHHRSPSDGTDFTIDFDKNEEVDHNKHDIKSVVKRTDLLKKIQEEVPKSWDKMPINPVTGKEDLVYNVKLDKKSQEYQKVQRMFDISMQQQQQSQATRLSAAAAIVGSLSVVPITSRIYSSILKIERVQNPTLYSQYMARKKEMDKFNPPGHQNERWLFHGTKPETCPNISHGGFNRSYCGQNATVYGKGVYFAHNASYSARDTYSPRDANGYKYIYLAKVLTGEFAKGAGGMLVPPPKDPSNPNVTFDSVVDDVANPNIFVVFQDAQNYPEYLITFQ